MNESVFQCFFNSFKQIARQVGLFTAALTNATAIKIASGDSEGIFKWATRVATSPYQGDEEIYPLLLTSVEQGLVATVGNTR